MNINDQLGGQDGGVYTANGSSAHYKDAVLEYVDKQERCYGTFNAWMLCVQQVDKYRDRAGKKAGVPADKDIIKANWYSKAAKYLAAKIDLFNLKNIVSLEEFNTLCFEFEDRYGLGRSTYIRMPEQVYSKLKNEFNLTDSLPATTLGDIVNSL